jgi:hypothetical protein
MLDHGREELECLAYISSQTQGFAEDGIHEQPSQIQHLKC